VVTEEVTPWEGGESWEGGSRDKCVGHDGGIDREDCAILIVILVIRG
jgi:hypothetical protein